MFTFKKRPRSTGLARITDRTSETEIKIKGREVGLIVTPLMFEDNVRVRFMVKCEEHPGWKWVTMKAGFETDADARAKLNEKFDWLTEKLDLHHQEG